MKKGQNTRGYARYIACDIHREYILVGGQNEDQMWVLAPRRVSLEKFPEWATLSFWKRPRMCGKPMMSLFPGQPSVGGECCIRRRDCWSTGEDGQGRYQAVAQTAHWQHCAGSVGATAGGARVASFHFVSEPTGQNEHDTCTCPAGTVQV